MPRFSRLLLALCFAGAASPCNLSIAADYGASADRGRPPGVDESGRYAEPIGGAPAIPNDTPYSAALRCLVRYTARRPVRIAVGQIPDFTGSSGESAVTEGASLMAVSALAKAGVAQVERLDISVAALDRKIGGEAGRQDGRAPASEYYLVGGITELNAGIERERNGSVMNIAVDLRLVDSATLEVADAVSYQKQIVGLRSRGGMAREPVQLAIRSTVERALLEMISRLYKVGSGSCEGSYAAMDNGDADAPDSMPRFFTPRSSPSQPLPRQDFY